jgi:hypothetical protein
MFEKVDFLEVYYVIREEYEHIKKGTIDDEEKLSDLALQSLWNALTTFFRIGFGNEAAFLTLKFKNVTDTLLSISVAEVAGFISISLKLAEAREKKKRGGKVITGESVDELNLTAQAQNSSVQVLTVTAQASSVDELKSAAQPLKKKQ